MDSKSTSTSKRIPLKWRELEQDLLSVGFELFRTDGTHITYKHPQTNRRFRHSKSHDMVQGYAARTALHYLEEARQLLPEKEREAIAAFEDGFEAKIPLPSENAVVVLDIPQSQTNIKAVKKIMKIAPLQPKHEFTVAYKQFSGKDLNDYFGISKYDVKILLELWGIRHNYPAKAKKRSNSLAVPKEKKKPAVERIPAPVIQQVVHVIDLDYDILTERLLAKLDYDKLAEALERAQAYSYIAKLREKK